MKTKGSIATVCVAALFNVHVVYAAELKGEVLQMCSSERIPSPAVVPSAINQSIASALSRGETGSALAKLAEKFESTLNEADKSRAEVRRFLERVRAPGDSDSTDFKVSRAAGKELIFETTDDEIVIECRTLDQAQIDMAAVSLQAARVLSADRIEGLKMRALAVAVADKKHTDLLTNGLAMWPWEMWLNGKRLGESDADPLFTRQIVFMRPSLGIEVNTRSRQAANLEGSLIVEPIGIVQYMNDDYSKWWGVSAIVTSSTRQGMGYGVLGRYGNYSLGITRHSSKVDGSPDDTFLMFSVDLYNLLQTKRAEIPEMRDKVKKLSGGLFSK